MKKRVLFIENAVVHMCSLRAKSKCRAHWGVGDPAPDIDAKDSYARSTMEVCLSVGPE